MPEGLGTREGTRSEGMQPGDGSGAGGGADMETINPELIATMQAEREEEDGGSGGNRLVVPLIEYLISQLEE